ncbi:MAG TPA: hypothetical protein VIY86_12045, partial [Pirellulaceae bacterium]
MSEFDVPLETPPSTERPTPVTDSPWLWLGVFLMGAMLALVLSQPKFQWRQPQIERQFQARERSGQAVSQGGGPRELSQTGNPMISLRPLLLLIAL